MSRTLAITTRVDLSDIDEGWEDCYAVVTKATYAEYGEISKFDKDDPDIDMKATLFSIDLAKKHFISGQVVVINDAGEAEKVAMQVDDIDASRDLADRIMAAVTGVAPDPKGSPTATETSSTDELPTSTNDTKTQ